MPTVTATAAKYPFPTPDVTFRMPDGVDMLIYPYRPVDGPPSWVLALISYSVLILQQKAMWDAWAEFEARRNLPNCMEP